MYGSKWESVGGTDHCDLVFLDHAQVTVGDESYLFLVTLNGTTNLLWVTPQKGERTRIHRYLHICAYWKAETRDFQEGKRAFMQAS